MLKNFVAGLKPYKRVYYLVHADHNTRKHDILEKLTLVSPTCKYWDEDSQGTTFKIELEYSAN